MKTFKKPDGWHWGYLSGYDDCNMHHIVYHNELYKSYEDLISKYNKLQSLYDSLRIDYENLKLKFNSGNIEE